MSELLDIVKPTLAKCQGSHVCSDREDGSKCDAMMLGSLIKSMVAGGLWPIPELPYVEFTFDRLSAIIKGLHCTSYCGAKKRSSYRPASFCHGVSNSFQQKVATVEANLAGLDIETV